MDFDPASRACTLPPHLKPNAERSARVGRLAEVARAVQHGQRVDPEDLRLALRIAMCVLLGGTPEEEGLVRFLKMGQPPSPKEGQQDALALLGALIADGGGGIASAVGQPFPAATREARDVIGDAALYPPQDVAAAMLRGGVAQVEIVGRDGTWAAVYVAGEKAEVDAALSRLDVGSRQTPTPLAG